MTNDTPVAGNLQDSASTAEAVVKDLNACSKSSAALS